MTSSELPCDVRSVGGLQLLLLATSIPFQTLLYEPASRALLPGRSVLQQFYVLYALKRSLGGWD